MLLENKDQPELQTCRHSLWVPECQRSAPLTLPSQSRHQTIRLQLGTMIGKNMVGSGNSQILLRIRQIARTVASCNTYIKRICIKNFGT